MSKLEGNLINYMRLLSIDMIKEASDNNYMDNYIAVPILYNLYLNHLIFDYNNCNYSNRDRVVVSPTFLPAYYSLLNFIGSNITLDNLKEYKKFNSIIDNTLSNKIDGIDTYCNSENIIGVSLGLSLGEKYLENLIKKDNPKSNIINFHTYVICNINELFIGNNLESLYEVVNHKLNNIHLILINNNNNNNKINRELDMLESLGYEIVEGDVSNINSNLGDVRNCKYPNVIVVSSKEKNITFNDEEIIKLKQKYKIDDPYNINNSLYIDIKKELGKRLDKKINKWKADINNSELTSQIINFLENKQVDVLINADNIKINDNYEEELNKGNNKILNLFASKSPFILSLSNNFNNSDTYLDNNKSILFKNINVMNDAAIGFASLGFKTFVSLPLKYSNLTYNTINTGLDNNLPIFYIFTNDTFLNIYNNSSSTCELNQLRMIPDLFNFRPADINEIIGTYAIISKLNKPCTITIGSEKVNKLIGTNPKYVVAGAYRVKRELGEATGVLVSSGSELKIALELAKELLPYNIDLRVVSIPSIELFEHQSDRYKYTLLPNDLKTFVLEFTNPKIWKSYVLNENYLLGVNKKSGNGTKEELLNYHDLNMDSLKARIIELMKEE